MAGSPLHFVVLAISAFFIVAVVMLHRRVRLRRHLAGMVLGFWVVMQVWYLMPAHFKAFESWPLHICDLANVIGPIALLTRWRWARTLLVFWGIGLTTQGFATPVVSEGPGETGFWLFWLNHNLVLLMAIDELVIGGYRPGWRDIGTAIGLSAVYVLVMFGLDAATGWNYGFVGPDQPDAPPTALALFGAWPLRVVWMAIVVAGAFVLMGWGFSKLPGGERLAQPDAV